MLEEERRKEYQKRLEKVFNFWSRSMVGKTLKRVDILSKDKELLKADLRELLHEESRGLRRELELILGFEPIEEKIIFGEETSK